MISYLLCCVGRSMSHGSWNVTSAGNDKENDNHPLLSSILQFVDLAGSERIAKSLTEGHRF